jgi:hypothetical protein
MTGRGAGYCAGYNMPGYANSAGRFDASRFGRGFSRRGGGFRRWFYSEGLPGWRRFGFSSPFNKYSKEDEKLFLKQQVEFLTQTIDDINRRLLELEKGE